jgi:hypothetical protein
MNANLPASLSDLSPLLSTAGIPPLGPPITKILASLSLIPSFDNQPFNSFPSPDGLPKLAKLAQDFDI